jgi:hypothetical protein
MGICVECIERTIAEDPRMAQTIANTARLLDKITPSGGAYLRSQAAVVVLLAFVVRCRPRSERRSTPDAL